MRELFSSIYTFFESRGLLGQYYKANDETAENENINSSISNPNPSNLEGDYDYFSNASANAEWSFSRVVQEKMLSDNEIHVALRILKSQFTEIKGLYDPQALNAKNLKKFQFYIEFPERFVQIVHDGHSSGHWLTITNLKSSHSHQIQAYDSLFMNKTYINNKKLNDYLKKIIFPATEVNNKRVEINNNHHFFNSNQQRMLIKEELIEIECSIESVQQQSDEIMCGLFAIAFAFDLCHGINPVDRHYDEKKMREHLLKCLKQGYFEEFPLVDFMESKSSILSETQIILIEI
jgi:hypothetical protein